MANAISPDGTITGFYFDSGGLGHGFVRARNGTFIRFDPPGVSTVPGLNTAPWGINPAGTTAGWWYTNIGPSFFAHGFLRTSDGAITTFDVPGASQTFGFNINPAGTVAGYYNAGGGNAPDLFRSFVRAPNGAITSFDVPGAGTAAFQGTLAFTPSGAISAAGTILGNYIDASNVVHGFVRAPNGAITSFDAPGAGTGFLQGTFPTSFNPAGAIVGFYVDANNVSHGFLLEGQ
jgi:predicted membrane protein